MLVHSASRFMQRIGKKRLGCNSSILIICVSMLTRQNKCIQPSMTFKILFRSLWKLHVFLMGQLPSVDADKHHDGSPSKNRPSDRPVPKLA